jgi:hypothetical protein
MRARLRSLAAGRPGAGSGRAAALPPARGGEPPAGGADTFEWRMREADGPTDVAHYACGCGYEFSARVETAVRCPHCGADQAW